MKVTPESCFCGKKVAVNRTRYCSEECATKKLKYFQYLWRKRNPKWWEKYG